MDMALLLVFGLAFYITWGIGSNDQNMAPLTGSGLLNITAITILGGISAFLGAVLMGGRVEETIGRGLLSGTVVPLETLIIVFSIATWLTIASYFGWPVSTTHSAVGAVLGMGWIKWGIDGIVWNNILKILFSWVASPVIGLLATMSLVLLTKSFLQHRVQGLRRYIRLTRYFAYFLLFWSCFMSFIAGANNIGNATAFLSLQSAYDPTVVRAVVSLGMLLGLVILGRRVIRSVGSKLVELTPITGLSTQICVSSVMLVGTYLGIPLSSTQILVGAITGVGLAEGSWIDLNRLSKIFCIWLVTFLGAASISAVTYLSIHLF
ncbi:MAG: inorganic phosphate transporter [Thermoproteota archaeon]